MGLNISNSINQDDLHLTLVFTINGQYREKKYEETVSDLNF